MFEDDKIQLGEEEIDEVGEINSEGGEKETRKKNFKKSFIVIYLFIKII